MQTLVLVVECGIADICPKAPGWNGEGVAFLLQSGELFGLMRVRSMPASSSEAGKPGCTADNAVDDADSAVSDHASSRHRRITWAEEVPQAEQHQQCADADPQISRCAPAQNFTADRNTDDAADQKRRQTAPLDRGAELPHPDNRDD